MKYENEHLTAIKAAFEASTVCAAIREETFNRMIKEDRTPVTIADFTAQALICDILNNTFPDDPIVAEEESNTLKEDPDSEFSQSVLRYFNKYNDGDLTRIIDLVSLGNSDVSTRFWTVDPLDGTKGFIRGGHYSIAIALVEHGKVVAAALGCPTWEPFTVFSAVRGHGAFKTTDPETGPVKIEQKPEAAPKRFVQSLEHTTGNKPLHQSIAEKLTITDDPLQVDSQLKYLMVALKQASVYLRIPAGKNLLYKEKIWDHGAGSLICQELGGTVTNRYGDELNFSQRTFPAGAGVCASIDTDHTQIVKTIEQFDA
jgi:3'(2'), 5'-bisphosphate nucleotidase